MERVDKSEYKQVVEKEKKKLVRQVVFLTVLAAVVAGAFLGVILNANPYNKAWSQQTPEKFHLSIIVKILISRFESD